MVFQGFPWFPRFPMNLPMKTIPAQGPRAFAWFTACARCAVRWCSRRALMGSKASGASAIRTWGRACRLMGRRYVFYEIIHGKIKRHRIKGPSRDRVTIHGDMWRMNVGVWCKAIHAMYSFLLSTIRIPQTVWPQWRGSYGHSKRPGVWSRWAE